MFSYYMNCNFVSNEKKILQWEYLKNIPLYVHMYLIEHWTHHLVLLFLVALQIKELLEQILLIEMKIK